MEKKKNGKTANVLEKLARTSVKLAADSRCMYIFHQPKQPTDIRRICNK